MSAQPEELPFVSVAMPTYNRRRFLPTAIACYESQTYPKHLMEWVIIDDGDDNVGDVFAALTLPNVRYIRTETRMLIGAKRNMLHRESRGAIIISMDDDDYYPPERVAHVVERFAAFPDIDVAGCSTLYMYFSHVQLIYRMGPFSPRHATNGTMAVRRAFALSHFYDESVSFGEEESFLNHFSFPVIQLSPLKVMLVMSHSSNTFDKLMLRDNPRALSVRTELRLEHFIKDAGLRAAFDTAARTPAPPFVPPIVPPKTLAARLAAVAARVAGERRPVAVRAGELCQRYAPAIVAAVAEAAGAAFPQPPVVGAPPVGAPAADSAAPAADLAPAHAPVPVPDFEIMHVLEARTAHFNPGAVSVVVSGESWQLDRQVDLLIAPVLSGNARLHIHYPHLYASLQERRQQFDGAAGAHDKFCAFMYSAECAHRNKIFDELDAVQPVDALGAQRNKSGQTAFTRAVYSETETYNDIAVRAYLDYKFVLAIENSWVPGYFTEKLINPILAGAVPVYWGHPSAFDFINKARVIYIPDFPSVAALGAHLLAMTPADWAAIVAAPVYTARGEPAAVELELRNHLKRFMGRKDNSAVELEQAAQLKQTMEQGRPGAAGAGSAVGSAVASSTVTPALSAGSTVAVSAAAPAARPAALKGLPPVYFINLDRRPDRRAEAEAEFAAYGLRAERISATDGKRAFGIVDCAPSNLRPAEIACSVSHLRAIKYWLENGGGDCAIIAEDDISLELVPRWGCDWGEIAAAIRRRCPAWEIVQLGVITTPGVTAVGNLHKRAPTDWGTVAYMIRRPYAERLVAQYWNAATARWRLDDMGVPYRLVADELLYRFSSQCYTIPLLVARDADSDIQPAGKLESFHAPAHSRTLKLWSGSADARALLQAEPTVEY